jgi:hypothetical protein
VLSGRDLCRAGHSSRGVLPRAVCLNKCDRGAPKNGKAMNRKQVRKCHMEKKYSPKFNYLN